MGERAPFIPPDWAKPALLGYGHAADAAHFVAAPLLAAASVTLIGVVGADSDKFRLASITLLVLSMAAVVLVGSVQYGFHARALLYSAADVETWWGRDDLQRWEELLRARQRRHYERWKRKIGRAVTTYNIGVTLLGTGVALCLVPAASASSMSVTARWAACAVVGVATLGELVWTVASPWRATGSQS